MSSLRFDGRHHTLSLIDRSGKQVGKWQAYNQTDTHATLRYVPNGSYVVTDRSKARYHTPDPNGPYGSYGIIRFHVQGHVGVGVHSGRSKARHRPGPVHPTMGCIRTTDAAMLAITREMSSDALASIQVLDNHAPLKHPLPKVTQHEH